MRALGTPPSLTSVTRDTYPAGAAFSAGFIATAACGVAAAAAHLHSRGIAHGDLYAHNILVDVSSGHAKLGDFGAAFHYGASNTGGGSAYEAIEARAYGILLKELLERYDGTGDGSSALPDVRSVSEACVGPAAGRPRFGDIAQRLVVKAPPGTCTL